VEELRDLTAGLDQHDWDIGTVRARPIPLRITHLIGIPREAPSPPPIFARQAG
jgi:hypothetical protein